MTHPPYEDWLSEPLRSFTLYTTRYGKALRLVITEHDNTEASMLRPDVVAVQTLYRTDDGQPLSKRDALYIVAAAVRDLADGFMVEVDSL